MGSQNQGKKRNISANKQVKGKDYQHIFFSFVKKHCLSTNNVNEQINK